MIRTLAMVATIFLALPIAVQAAPVGQKTLSEHRQACVSECVNNRSEQTCQRVCDCITDFIAKNWSRADFEAKTARISENRDDPGVNSEYREIARQCAAQ